MPGHHYNRYSRLHQLGSSRLIGKETPMNESGRLAEQLSKALNGDAWHGPSWREVLEGIGRDAALHRPIPDAHTIAEVLLHATAWNDVVHRRLEGETPKVSGAEDWPAESIPDDASWSATLMRFEETDNALVATLDRFPAVKLNDNRPGTQGTWYDLIVGQLQHLLYHAGQVALLKKARVHASV